MQLPFRVHFSQWNWIVAQPLHEQLQASSHASDDVATVQQLLYDGFCLGNGLQARKSRLHRHWEQVEVGNSNLFGLSDEMDAQEGEVGRKAWSMHNNLQGQDDLEGMIDSDQMGKLDNLLLNIVLPDEAHSLQKRELFGFLLHPRVGALPSYGECLIPCTKIIVVMEVLLRDGEGTFGDLDYLQSRESIEEELRNK